MPFSEDELAALNDFILDVVTPETDADPVVLADYLLTLLKTDATRDQCKEEMEMFFGDKSSSILDRVFQAIDSKSYMETKPAPDSQPQQDASDVAAVTARVDDNGNGKSKQQINKTDVSEVHQPAPPTKRPLDASVDMGLARPTKQPRRDAPPLKRSRRRCYNYDVKGYCLRAESCPFDHSDLDLPYTTRYTSFSTKMVVDRIPDDKCNVDSVTECFEKFGKLLSVTVDMATSRAFIQFDTHAQALAAFQSPDVFFGNRFVRVYWKNVDEVAEYQEYEARRHAEPDPKAIQAVKDQLAKEKAERVRAEIEMRKKQLEIQEQAVQKRIEEQKKLIEKLAKTPPGSAEREEIKAAITKLMQPTKTQAPATAPSTTTSSTEKASAPTNTTPTTLANTMDEKMAEMQRLKAKLQQLEAAKQSRDASAAHGGATPAWTARGGRVFNLDNRQKLASSAVSTTSPAADSASHSTTDASTAEDTAADTSTTTANEKNP
ncbi:hypothetical protein BC940DRAFT_307133 [Gongronella butleri]|nr:hypothetical protein BC940DRAFT_307133 [Gongronella butleri]